MHVLLNYFPEVEPMKKILIRLPAEWLEEIQKIEGYASWWTPRFGMRARRA